MLTLERVRDTVFIGHANPEDNEFTLWLGLQLASHGYKVWSDILKLLGGEDFWKDIEVVIRTIAAKHLYVLSRTSNTKPGPLKELAVGNAVAKKEQLHDFVIPLHIDDLPHGEINIELNRLNAIDFSKSWAAGLAQLLKKLDEEQIPHSTNTPATVNAYWRSQFSDTSGVTEQADELFSNEFPISLPDMVYRHASTKIDDIKPETLPFPSFRHEGHLVSFASKDHLQNVPLYIVSTQAIATSDYLEGKTGEERIDAAEAMRHVTRLLRIAWERKLRSVVHEHEMSNKRRSYYFAASTAHGHELPYLTIERKKTTRAVVGYRTVMNVKRFWHFAISARPWLRPTPRLSIQTHLLFSDDGKTIWSDDKRMQRARHGQTKDWWNNDWRDRLLVVMQHLANDSGIALPVSRNEHIRVDASPLRFVSPVTYAEPTDHEDIDTYDDDDPDEAE